MEEKPMDIYRKAVLVEDDLYKLNYAASIVALVAERLQDNDESSALWAASDLIKVCSERAETQLQELRALVFAAKNSVPAKPAPKKRGRPAKKASKK